jgi:hypothetical protein
VKTSPTTPPRLLLDLKETAGTLGVSPWTVRCWVADGTLKPVKLPQVRQSNPKCLHRRGQGIRKLLFSVADITALIENGKKERV